ncbi:MAG: helicase-related protein, partial [archaeon]|nr:helicase-related protein [archaeon]
DEADRMFDMGFEPQVTKIIDNVRPDRQTALFSATFPKAVEKLARKILRSPIQLVAGERSSVCSDVKQVIEVLPEPLKSERLAQLIAKFHEQGQVLVFVERKESCDSLFAELKARGYGVRALHGGMPQSERNSTLFDFRKGHFAVLVATSIAARGLDVKGLRLVVNFDVPHHLEDYVHRVGRTGRAGNKGCAHTFISKGQERHAKMLIHALSQAGEDVPEELTRLAEQYSLKLSGIASGDPSKPKTGRRAAGFGGHGLEREEGHHLNQVILEKLAMGVPLDPAEEQALSGSVREKHSAGEELFPAISALVKEAVMSTPGSLTLKDLPQICSLMPAIASAAEARELVLRVDLGQQRSKEAVQALEMLAGMVAQRIARRASSSDSSSSSSSSSSSASQNRFEDELEINQYPKNVRRDITKAETIQDINEWTGAAITSKGTFVEPGRPPAPGQRKLYLLIEGPSAHAVVQAKREIFRILQESMARAANSNANDSGYGKWQLESN